MPSDRYPQTFLTFWPRGEQPNSSSLYPAPDARPTPNAVITQLSDMIEIGA